MVIPTGVYGTRLYLCGERMVRNVKPAANGYFIIGAFLLQARDELEVIGPGMGSVLAMGIEEARSQGIDVMIDMTNRVLEYELRIPLISARRACFTSFHAAGFVW
jgi:hypothetical protein